MRYPLTVFLFSVVIRGLPGSTLFPYTTLFRSHELQAAGNQAAEAYRRLRDFVADTFFENPRRNRAAAGRLRDRKSTRLNSSHVEISYAVFCLKKKKKSQHTESRTHSLHNATTR